MAAALIWEWTNVRAGTEVAVYIHGYGGQQAVSYSLSVIPQNFVGVLAGGGIVISRVEHYVHADGTQAKKVIVDSLASATAWNNVQLLQSVDSF